MRLIAFAEVPQDEYCANQKTSPKASHFSKLPTVIWADAAVKPRTLILDTLETPWCSGWVAYEESSTL